jgi:hypothetical protein
MAEGAAGREEQARTAAGDSLKEFLHESDEATLVALLENPALDESHLATLQCLAWSLRELHGPQAKRCAWDW